MDFEFIVGTPPDEECIQNFHKTLAQGLINKYGSEKIDKLIKAIETKEEK